MSYQSIYNHLRNSGLSVNGALALMGNWDCESNCEACRVQGDFTSNRSKSHQYAANVDSGVIGKTSFMKDAKGWGLAQWTYWSRKGDLYYWCKNRGVSIADESAQVDFGLHELSTQYPGLLSYLKSDCDLYTAVSRVCKEYERPAINNVDARFQAANRIKGQIDLNPGPSPEPQPQPSPTPTPSGDVPTTPFWPPRMLDEGMIGSDVMALQALLIAHGYSVTAVNGIFDGSTKAAATKFQAVYLGRTGAFGPKSWAALLRM